jgi:hypothetical protein
MTLQKDISSINAWAFVQAIRSIHGDVPEVTDELFVRYPEDYLKDSKEPNDI